jgi:predicted DNA-binding protein
MERQTTILLKPETHERLVEYAAMLGMPAEALAERALEALFEELDRQLGERALGDREQSLSYDEFWDGVDI